MRIRTVNTSDYDYIVSVVDDWWDGRSMQRMLPRLFFDHFQDTTLVVEHNCDIAGFLTGFISPTQTSTAYIHFVGVAPSHRGQGVGRSLYNRFFELVGESCCDVRCVTAPTNKDSIAFHRNLGFEIEPSVDYMEHVPYFPDYDGPGEHRVLFRRALVSG